MISDRNLRCSFLIFGFLAACSTTLEQRAAYYKSGQQKIVATQGFVTTDAAAEIFNQGGNIVDAAIASSFVSGVERPQSTGIGGGGFLLFYEAKSGKVWAVDFRERAPRAAREKMFLNEKGEVLSGLSVEGPLSVATPGLVAGLYEIHSRFGKLPWAQLLLPAIGYARKGIRVYANLATALEQYQEVLAKYPATRKIYLDSQGRALKEGDLLVQEDLAKTLEQIAARGKSAFYEGPLANLIVQEVKSRGGLLTHSDLKNYKVKWRQALKGSYQGLDVYSFPPPSSGGVHVLQILNLLEAENWSPSDFGTREVLHKTALAMQQAFKDRATHLGDPDFVSVPVKELTSKAYAAKVRTTWPLDRALRSEELSSLKIEQKESHQTTHFSMMDREGNALLSTQTINGYFGSKLVVPGTGIILNNEMDDFSAKPGASNLFGAIGSQANKIEAKKTPLSSMSPTLIMRGNTPMLGLGAPGGTKIITCVVQTILNYIHFKKSLYEAIAAPRLHHQFFPDRLDLESNGFDLKVQEDLRAMGYKIQAGEIPCRVNAVAFDGVELKGAADPRDIGSVWSR